MNTAEKNCIWYDQCSEGCCAGCGDYTPTEDNMAEMYYRYILDENASEYDEMIFDYTDRGVWGES